MAVRSGSQEPGLPSLNEARRERQRAIATGKVRLRAMRPVFWLWAGIILTVFGIVYFRISMAELESQKSAVMARQRAVAKTLGPRLLPFVENIEGWVLSLAGPFAGTTFAPDASLEAIAKQPGVYLRLRLQNAQSREKLRHAAAASLHDGFTSCFFVQEGAPDPTSGPKCERSADCQAGLLCNEWDICSPVPRPYNLRLAYRAWRILSSEFTDSLHEASNDLQVRAQERDLDQVTRVDVPVAIEVLQRARYVTVVLDEAAPKEEMTNAEAIAGETADERLQRLPHDARVGVWELATGRLLLRFRGRAEGRLVTAGRPVVLEPRVAAARLRQANSCALAWELRERLLKRVEKDAAPAVGASSDSAVPAAAAGAVLPALSGAGGHAGAVGSAAAPRRP